MPMPCGGELKKKLTLCLKTLFHCVGSVLCVFVLIWGCVIWFTIDEKLLENPVVMDIKKYSPLYLTNWNYIFQTVFLSLSLLHDVLQWLGKHETNIAKKLRYLRDVIFSGLVIPYTMFISTMFWTVYWIDRELVFPQAYDMVVPWWFNHCVHTNIAVVIAVETILTARRYPADLKVELILNSTIGILYAIVYYSIYFFAHRWLYGVFGVLTWWQVCLYQILIWGSTFVFYYIQFPINRLFHGEEEGELPEIQNEEKNGKSQNGFPKNGADFKTDSEETWNLKCRSKGQFENSVL